MSADVIRTRGDFTREPLGAETEMKTVRLTVSDLGRSRAFYETVLGLTATELVDGGLALGPAGGPALIELTGDTSASPLDRRATGLFHLAIRLPTRLDLAHALARLGEARWPLDGASEHLVSEALYLSDPDGNGIEIYRDRPRERWDYDDHGNLRIGRFRLDLRGLADELSGEDPLIATIASGARMGHVHLQVSNIDEAEAFYCGVLGFDVVIRGVPGALFIAAGGYHHHIGLNTWRSAGSSPPSPRSLGLRSFDVKLADRGELERLLARVAAAGLPVESITATDALVRDPSNNAVVLGLR